MTLELARGDRLLVPRRLRPGLATRRARVHARLAPAGYLAPRGTGGDPVARALAAHVRSLVGSR